jgi:hypothetical protein
VGVGGGVCMLFFSFFFFFFFFFFNYIVVSNRKHVYTRSQKFRDRVLAQLYPSCVPRRARPPILHHPLLLGIQIGRFTSRMLMCALVISRPFSL